MIVAAPLLVEQIAARSLRPIRTGAKRGRVFDDDVLVIGVAGALTDGMRPGDLVVDGPELFANRLRAAGLRVHEGSVATVDHLVDTARERAELAATGAIAVDTESALLRPRGDHHFAIVRAIVDTPRDRLKSVGTVGRGITALRSLRRAASALKEVLQ